MRGVQNFGLNKMHVLVWVHDQLVFGIYARMSADIRLMYASERLVLSIYARVYANIRRVYAGVRFQFDIRQGLRRYTLLLRHRISRKIRKNNIVIPLQRSSDRRFWQPAIYGPGPSLFSCAENRESEASSGWLGAALPP